jgi:hypothetical protein
MIYFYGKLSYNRGPIEELVRPLQRQEREGDISTSLDGTIDNVTIQSDSFEEAVKTKLCVEGGKN